MRWVFLFALLPVAGPLYGQSWPVARSAHVMTYHDRLGEVVLLGGVDSTVADVLWGWNGERWRQLASGGPVNRGHFAMAFDPVRNRLVVQGGARFVRGATPRRFGDTWEWDGRGWQQVPAAGGPGQRDHHAMVFDVARKQLVLFGGADATQNFFDDTWTWNGREWRKLAEGGPPARTTHRMAYDAKRNVVVLFGGWGKNGQLLNDTWEWDGARWTQKSDSGPSARFATRIAYDGSSGRTILFAGRGANGDLGDTWAWDGNRWERLEVTGPPIRNVHEMTYDAARKRVVMFGGFFAPRQYNDLWEFANGRWSKREQRSFAAPAGGLLTPGEYRVGYRVINQRDQQRTSGPARNFEGVVNPAPVQAPLQFSVWYPAQADGRAMDVGDYRALSATSEALRAVTAQDRETARTDLISTARFGLNTDLAPRDADAMLTQRVHARENATPLPNRFPLIVGGMEGPGGSYALAEFLASHGFVVVTLPSMSGTRTEQATQSAVALDMQAHRLETAIAFARGLPFADTTKLGLIGKNFDGMAALLVQLRNMHADAVVTLDGWEGKSNTSSALTTSPFFDVLKMRIPYLTFQQDNAPSPNLAADYVLFDRFKYSDRTSYILEDLEHIHLINHAMDFPGITSGQRLAYDFYYRTITDFMKAHVARDTAAARAVRTTPQLRGYPDAIIAARRSAEALPAVPMAAEVEAIVMSGDIDKLANVFRAARARDPNVQLFTRQTLELYAFRYNRRGESARVIAIHRLATEAFPQSSLAFNNLGNSLRDAGQPAEALAAFRRALELVAGDTDISEAEKAQSRTVVQNKIDALSR